jgi:ABC-type branched-subunit amino acid transport system permease subunit
MTEKLPTDQAQEPSETSAPAEGRRREASRLGQLRQRRAELRERRKAATATLRSTIAKDLRPVTKRTTAAREFVNDNSKWTYPLIGIVLVALAAFLPYLNDYIDLPIWAQRATSGSALARVMLFILFALGLNVVVGFAGLLDLGYVAFWALGSYTAAILTGAHAFTQTRINTPEAAGAEPIWDQWMWLILIAALGVAVIAGIVLGSPTLRLRGDYLAIVTLGFGEIIRITANNLDSVTGGPRGVRNIPHPILDVGPINVEWGTLIDTKYYFLFLALVVIWIVAVHLLDNSRIGRAWVAIREDEIAAAAMGVPVVRMKLAAFAIGACTAGVGGVVYASQVGFINPTTFNIFQSILILTMVVIGGMGSIAGAIVGSAVVVLLPEIFRGFEDYRFFAFGVVIVLMMIFRPQGLLPSKRRKAELQGATADEQLYEAAHAGG